MFGIRVKLKNYEYGTYLGLIEDNSYFFGFSKEAATIFRNVEEALAALENRNSYSEFNKISYTEVEFLSTNQ